MRKKTHFDEKLKKKSEKLEDGKLNEKNSGRKEVKFLNSFINIKTISKTFPDLGTILLPSRAQFLTSAASASFKGGEVSRSFYKVS